MNNKESDRAGGSVAQVAAMGIATVGTHFGNPNLRLPSVPCNLNFSL